MFKVTSTSKENNFKNTFYHIWSLAGKDNDHNNIISKFHAKY